jgi:hypothetical protein
VAAFLAPVYSLMLESVPGLLYAATWADPHGDFMVSGTPDVIYAMVVSTLLGVLPTGLLLYGTFLVLRSPREHRAWVGPAAFGAAIVLAFLRYSWVFPSYAAVKATYLLPAMLPASYAVVVALDRFGARTRSALRGALLAIGTVVAAITWWGWWW